MKAKAEEYYLAVDRFVEDVAAISEDVRSTVMFGSIARDEVIPGQSDMMDAYVFLQHGVFENKTRFLNAIEALAQAFERIANVAPGPYHPFFYWDELDPVPATFHHEMTALSKTLFGSEIRESLRATMPSREVARTAFFEIRRLGAPLMTLLHKKELVEEEAEALFKGLVTIMRDVPMSACMALDIWVGGPDSLGEIHRLFPGLDTSVVDKIAALRLKEQPTADHEELRLLLREAMIFVETLNDSLISTLKSEYRR